LTEEDRKAAWEEFENEKKGINNLVGNPSVNNLASFNFNPEEIAVSLDLLFFVFTYCNLEKVLIEVEYNFFGLMIEAWLSSPNKSVFNTRPVRIVKASHGALF